MEIVESEVAYKKKVGTMGGHPLYEIGLKGGLCLIAGSERGKVKIIAVGPHPAVSRHIAKKRADGEIVFTDLNKADHVPLEHFAFCLPHYEAETDRVQASFARIQGL